MEHIIKELKEYKEKQAFALTKQSIKSQEIARGIVHKGKYRMTHHHNGRFGKALTAYEDFSIEEIPTLLERLKSEGNKARGIEQIKHLYSPDVNRNLILLLSTACNLPMDTIKELLSRYEDYYALTQTTPDEVANHRIPGIGPATSMKIASIMKIASGEY